MAQIAKSGALRTPHFAKAAKRTKEYVARIADNPTACPMFPPTGEHSGSIETISYVQGYLAGLIVSTGKLPTKAEMEALRFDVMHDPAVRDVILKMDKPVELVPEGMEQREY